jgi:hypothetical protein
MNEDYKIENEKNFFKFIDSINSDTKTNSLIKYKTSLGAAHSKASGSVSSVSNLNTNSHNCSKKLGSIMGIAKRSRSIHYTECPRKSTWFSFFCLRAFIVFFFVVECFLYKFYIKFCKF